MNYYFPFPLYHPTNIYLAYLTFSHSCLGGYHGGGGTQGWGDGASGIEGGGGGVGVRLHTCQLVGALGDIV